MKLTLVFLLNGLFLPLAIVKSACDGIGNGDLKRLSLRHQLQKDFWAYKACYGTAKRSFQLYIFKRYISMYLKRQEVGFKKDLNKQAL